MRLLLLTVVVLLAGPCAAHDARPLSVTIVEQTRGIYRTIVREPPTVEPGNSPDIVWPAPCVLLESAQLNFSSGSAGLVDCPGGLETRTIRIEYPAYNPSLTTLLRLLPSDQPPLTAVLPPDRLSWTVPAEPTLAGIALDYTRLGFAHIWAGPDHLLFVAGLLLLARGARRIVLAITGFTLAHSLTLSLAATGLVRVPIEPVEAMIALSILFLAVEIARADTTSFSHRYPVALSFVFGLLHGFGFASALGEIGLPRGELVAGLLFFNAGVELGQLAFIAVVLGGVLTAMRMLGSSSATPHRLVPTGAYALGIPAAFWFIERTALAFGV